MPLSEYFEIYPRINARSGASIRFMIIYCLSAILRVMFRLTNVFIWSAFRGTLKFPGVIGILEGFFSRSGIIFFLYFSYHSFGLTCLFFPGSPLLSITFTSMICRMSSVSIFPQDGHSLSAALACDVSVLK